MINGKIYLYLISKRSFFFSDVLIINVDKWSNRWTLLFSVISNEIYHIIYVVSNLSQSDEFSSALVQEAECDYHTKNTMNVRIKVISISYNY